MIPWGWEMREYKFRGKRVDNGEWIYGSFIKAPNDEYCKAFISIDDYLMRDIDSINNDKSYLNFVGKFFEVIPETVGEYTGLKDKNGKEIYEGDLVTAEWYDYEEPNHDTTGEVIFNQGWMSYCIWNESDKTMNDMNGQGYYHWDIEIIGNIYENPELMK
jgi:uncharacterized phage protein (TIGR01671 family)